jgi:hypothetical protein
MLMIRVTVNLNKFGKPYVVNRMQIDKEFREKDDDYTVVTLDDVQPETEDRTAWLYGPNVFRELTNEELFSKGFAERDVNIMKSIRTPEYFSFCLERLDGNVNQFAPVVQEEVKKVVRKKRVVKKAAA